MGVCTISGADQRCLWQEYVEPEDMFDVNPKQTESAAENGIGVTAPSLDVDVVTAQQVCVKTSFFTPEAQAGSPFLGQKDLNLQ